MTVLVKRLFLFRPQAQHAAPGLAISIDGPSASSSVSVSTTDAARVQVGSFSMPINENIFSRPLASRRPNCCPLATRPFHRRKPPTATIRHQQHRLEPLRVSNAWIQKQRTTKRPASSTSKLSMSRGHQSQRGSHSRAHPRIDHLARASRSIPTKCRYITFVYFYVLLRSHYTGAHFETNQRQRGTTGTASTHTTGAPYTLFAFGDSCVHFAAAAQLRASASSFCTQSAPAPAECR